MNYLKNTFIKNKSQILLTAGFLYSAFTFGTIIDSSHKYEINKLNAEINKLKST
jgi:hypothetical protein